MTSCVLLISFFYIYFLTSKDYCNCSVLFLIFQLGTGTLFKKILLLAIEIIITVFIINYDD